MAAALVLLLIASATAIPFETCENVDTATNVEIPCGEVCEVTRGESFNFSLTFISTVSAESLEVVLSAMVNGEMRDYPPTEANACSKLDKSCPIEPWVRYVYFTRIPVPAAGPRESGLGKVQLVDKTSRKVITCVQYKAVAVPKN